MQFYGDITLQMRELLLFCMALLWMQTDIFETCHSWGQVYKSQKPKHPQSKAIIDFPGGSVGKEPDWVHRRPRFDPWVGRSPGKGNGNPLYIFAWEIPWTEEPGGQ